MNKTNERTLTSDRKMPFSFFFKRQLLRLRVHILTNPSVLRICMIFLLYCTAVSFLLMGIQLFREEQMIERTVQQRVAQAVSDQSAPYSVLYLPKEEKLQRGIAQNVIRLHVIANSDSLEDQRLKLHVRDRIIGDLQNCLKFIDSQKKAEEVIASRLAEIQKETEEVIQKDGYTYTASISLCDRMFPVKQYGDLTFPAGIYRALCIQIGEAEGHNWWCVLFPSLCFVDETTATIPDDSKEKLKKSLTEEEYELLSEPPEAHSLFLDWLSKN
ncbi:MAG: stage II sporulation protein R [Lachnospiraceae bacterium]|nr:stage II sporulation protein R [Lachnospiraceae bacterium]